VDVLQVRDSPQGSDRRFRRLSVSPPLPVPDGQAIDEVVVTERHFNTDIAKLELTGSQLGKAWVPVYVFRLIDHSPIEGGTISEAALDLAYAWAELARKRDLLPPTQEEYFERNFRRLEEYVAREGNARVPQSYVVDGLHLAAWVANIKFEQANFGFRKEWRDRLDALPGWRWLPGNDFVLL